MIEQDKKLLVTIITDGNKLRIIDNSSVYLMSLIFFTNSDLHTYRVNVLKLWETLRQVDNFHPIISSVHGAVCPSIFIPQFEFMIQCVLAFSSNKFSLWCSSVASNNSQFSEQLFYVLDLFLSSLSRLGSP